MSDSGEDLPWPDKPRLPQATLRATLVGLAIGSVVLILNFQFGLQTGWVLMMSLPSALLGYTIFRVTPMARTFSDVENVYIQSVAVAVGTGPLAYGLVGIVPAIEKFLTPDESGTGARIVLLLPQLVVWSLGLALFGVFFAVPLRRQVIITEKLPFPSGAATATLISVLHGTKVYDETLRERSPVPLLRSDDSVPHGGVICPHDSNGLKLLGSTAAYRANIRLLAVLFGVSACYTLAAFAFPVLRALPIFGARMSHVYQWNFQPLPAYIGQGIIMGLPSVLYMMFGAVLGWGVLAPLLKHLGWAPGPIDDWVTGGQGWILWLSLSVMIADLLVSFVVVTIRSVASLGHRRAEQRPLLDTESASSASSFVDVAAAHLVDNRTTVVGIVFLSVLCMWAVRVVFGPLIPHYATATAIVLALLFSVLGVRALGETDLNPVSGIGKLSQLIFAVVIPRSHPAKILINLVAGGIAEAGAQQAGDLMQDLKTGHLIGASPKAQFAAQLIGTLYSVFLSSVMYKVYNRVYEIPSKMFRIPTAVVWIDCSRLVTGEGLPPHAFEVSLLFGAIFGAVSVIKNTVPRTSKYHRYLVYLPNGVAVGIGIYNTPNFTLARFLGGLLAYVWIRHAGKHNADKKVKMVIVSSGLVLGEGLLSAVTMLLTSLGVRHY